MKIVCKFTNLHRRQILHVIWDRISKLHAFGSTDQCSTSTFCIIDVPFTATEHVFIFMNFTNFSICAASKCIYNIAASYLGQYNLCKSQADSRRGVHCSAAPIKVASNPIFLIPPPQPNTYSEIVRFVIATTNNKTRIASKESHHIPE